MADATPSRTSAEAPPQLQRKLRKVRQLLASGAMVQAADLCEHLLRTHPDQIDLLMLYSRICQSLGAFDRMLVLARHACELHPDSVDARARLAECLLYCSQIGDALKLTRALENDVWNSTTALQRLSEFYQHCGQYADALRCQARAMELEPDNARFAYDAASSCVALGHVEQAEALYDRAIFLDPDDHDAWQVRSGIRRQTLQDNHAKQLGYVLEHLAPDDPGRAPVYYALAKELEDLAEYDTAFECLQSGAAIMRKAAAYDVVADEKDMATIAASFDAEYLRATAEGFEAARPVFIVGLPRTGIALLDRLLALHDGIDSVGPVNSLIFALIHGIGPIKHGREVLERAPDADVRRLGERYWNGIRGLGRHGPVLVDCTPVNFQYLGLIARALPAARVIHLRRHPLDGCMAMYKTMFRSGHEYANSLADISRYYVAYHRLMGHWRRHLPVPILDLDYEALVDDPVAQLGDVLRHLGIDSQTGEAPDLDTSRREVLDNAAHLEEPAGIWKHYEKQLEPLAKHLRVNGVPVD